MKGNPMPIQKVVPTIEVTDEILAIQIYQTLDEALAETSDLNIVKSYAKLIEEAYQKALALLVQQVEAKA
jgi:hypothetical protein